MPGCFSDIDGVAEDGDVDRHEGVKDSHVGFFVGGKGVGFVGSGEAWSRGDLGAGIEVSGEGPGS